MYIRKTMTDSVDSVIIADVIRFGRYCETSVEPGDLQAIPCIFSRSTASISLKKPAFDCAAHRSI